MKVLKFLFSKLHIFVLWLLFSAFFWAWIFTFLTDTAPEKKVTVFISAYGLRDTELAVELEKDMPEGLKMVKVHPFSYAMFEEQSILGADIFIVKDSEAEGYMDSFARVPLPEGYEYYMKDGEPRGVLIYDAQTGRGGAADFITYPAPDGSTENYYLFFGVESLHTGDADDAAFRVARLLLGLE